MTPNHNISFSPDGVEHLRWLQDNARRQLTFFEQSLRPDGRFCSLNWDGSPKPETAQELHTTSRMIHSFALGKALGHEGADKMIDAGMDALWNWHRDQDHGGCCWQVDGTAVVDGLKLAYGHVFVLLAAASAKKAGHLDADRLIEDVTSVLDAHYWDKDYCRFREEYQRDWTAFSSYRGMNANMHGVEALLTAYEATGEDTYLHRAGQILDFFVGVVAQQYDWRIPEHFTKDWQIDPTYAGNPMFRPAGSTPGHSFELGRLLIQHWDLSGKPDSDAVEHATNLISRALSDAWLPEGGFCYTLDLDGRVAVRDRYWWPVTEALGALAVCQNVCPSRSFTDWYTQIWTFAQDNFIDREHGGWFPELNAAGAPCETQFVGKPDIYHSLQADLLSLTKTPSRLFESLEPRN